LLCGEQGRMGGRTTGVRARNTKGWQYTRRLASIDLHIGDARRNNFLSICTG